MNDVAKELALENREKKRTAASASKRVGVSKKCTLPYEMMDRKARREYMKPSEVTTFVLRPMPLVEFRRQDGDKQLELLKWYGEKYGWSIPAVAEALDCSYNAAYELVKRFMLDGMFKARARAMSEEQKKKCKANRAVMKADKTLQSGGIGEGRESIPPQNENATRTAEKPKAGQFTVLMEDTCTGAILARCLEGLSHSLDPDARYGIRLSLTKLPVEEQSEGDVIDS